MDKIQREFTIDLQNAISKYSTDLVDIYIDKEKDVSLMHCGDNSFPIGKSYSLSDVGLDFLKETEDIYNVSVMNEDGNVF